MAEGGSQPTREQKRARDSLLKTALGYPETHEDNPWGEKVVKVKGKVFVFLSLHQGNLTVTTKLATTGEQALMLEFTSPTGYGLGKSGWVTARFEPGEDIPVELLAEWLDESFRHVAPKKVIAVLDGETAPAKKKNPAAKKKPAKKKKPAAKKRR